MVTICIPTFVSSDHEETVIGQESTKLKVKREKEQTSVLSCNFLFVAI